MAWLSDYVIKGLRKRHHVSRSKNKAFETRPNIFLTGSGFQNLNHFFYPPKTLNLAAAFLQPQAQLGLRPGLQEGENAGMDRKMRLVTPPATAKVC